MFTDSTKVKLDKLVSWMLIVLMGLMVINVSWQVISRYFLQNPSSFTDELARYMLIWIGMLGAAFVAGKEDHLAIDIMLNKMDAALQRKMRLLIYVLVFLFAASVLVLGGANLVFITFTLEQRSAALHIPLAYVYAVLPFSGMLVCYYQVIGLVKIFKQPVQ